MASERGKAFLLKLGDGGEPMGYATIAGLKTTSLCINGDAVPATTKSVGWRKLLSGAGVRSVGIAATGIFTGNSSEADIRNRALAGTVDDYEMAFESGEKMRGQFLVTRLEYVGDFNGERSYSIALESSGEVASA